MKDYIVENKQFLGLMFLWFIVGAFLPTAMFAVVPLSVIALKNKQLHKEIFIGFFLVLIFSDSRQSELHWAQSVKNIYIVLLLLFQLVDKKRVVSKISVFSLFIPFLLFSIFCLFNSPVISTSILKTISYFALIYVVTSSVFDLLIEDPEDFFRSIVYFVMLLLLVGLVIYVFDKNVATFVGRYRGVFGNPNGIGLFCLIFFLVFNVILDFKSDLFGKNEVRIIYAILFLSMFMSGSRSSIFSVLLFLSLKKVYKISYFLGFIIMLAFGFVYQFITLNIVTIIKLLSLQEFFRLDTLEDGSGRLIAWKFAWDNIQHSIFFGKGFSYTDFLFSKNYSYLSMLGHQGNAHNSFLTFWLDTGLVGLFLFFIGFVGNFLMASKVTAIALPIMYTVIFSAFFESWLTGSLNPITIQIWIMLPIMLWKFKDKTNENPLPIH